MLMLPVIPSDFNLPVIMVVRVIQICGNVITLIVFSFSPPIYIMKPVNAELFLKRDHSTVINSLCCNAVYN